MSDVSRQSRDGAGKASAAGRVLLSRNAVAALRAGRCAKETRSRWRGSPASPRSNGRPISSRFCRVIAVHAVDLADHRRGRRGRHRDGPPGPDQDRDGGPDRGRRRRALTVIDAWSGDRPPAGSPTSASPRNPVGGRGISGSERLQGVGGAANAGQTGVRALVLTTARPGPRPGLCRPWRSPDRRRPARLGADVADPVVVPDGPTSARAAGGVYAAYDLVVTTAGPVARRPMSPGTDPPAARPGDPGACRAIRAYGVASSVPTDHALARSWPGSRGMRRREPSGVHGVASGWFDGIVELVLPHLISQVRAATHRW